MASIDVAKLLNKITQDIPGINTVLKALAKWDVSALSDVPDGAMQATTDANNNLTIKKKVSGSYTPVAKLMHDVDKLDGYHASASATANTVAVRNASGALPGNILGNAATATTATALATGAVVPVNQGGTGATTASQARANLGVADGTEFTTHIAKQASPSVEGHVKLDALAADGSNKAAPGGFGLGATYAAQIPANTNLDTVVLPGFYSCKQSTTVTTLTNCPIIVAFSMLVEFCAYGPIQTITANNDGARFQRTKTGPTTFGPWRSLPNGITDSTSTVSSTIAASASAVKAANGAASAAQTDASTALARTAPATPEKAGTIKPGKGVAVASDGTLNIAYWRAFPPCVPIPVWGVTFGGSDGRRAIMPGETSAREDWIRCDGGSDGKGGTVPNLVGRVPLGASSSYTAGSTGGSATHEHTVTGNTGETTLSTTQMASHSHTVTAGYKASGSGYTVDYQDNAVTNTSRTTSTVGSNASHLHSLSVSTSTTSNMMPYCALYYVIRII